MEISEFDSVTGLLNRQSLVKIGHLLATMPRNVGFIYIDIDYLRTINDIYGITPGDSLLVKWARTIEGLVPENALIARWAGDEFLVVVPDLQDQEVLELAYTLHARLSRATILYCGHTCGPLTAKIGVACFPSDGATATDLIDATEAAIYSEQSRGRNCVVIASELAAKPV